MRPSEVMDDYVRISQTGWHHVDLQGHQSLNMLSCMGFSRIHNAVLGISSESVIQAALYANEEINDTDAFGRTPLHWAVITASGSATSTLLCRGANPRAKDRNGASAIHLATSSNSISSIRSLLEHSGKALLEQTDRFGSTPVHWASHSGSYAALEYLLGKGANANAQTLNGESPLYYASRGHDLRIVQLLERYGARRDQLDRWGYDAYLDAAFADSHEVLEYYLQDIPNLGRSLFDGSTLLHIVARCSKLDTIKILLRHKLRGLKVGARDNAGFTAIDYAQQRRDEVIEGPFLDLICQIEGHSLEDTGDNTEDQEAETEVYYDALE